MFILLTRLKFSQYLQIIALRVPLMIVIISSYYFLLFAFGTHIPLVQVINNFPIIFLAGMIPITPAGLGTINLLAVEMLSPHMQGAILQNAAITAGDLMFAASLLWEFTNLFLKTAVGVILMHFVAKQNHIDTAFPKTLPDI